MQEVQNGSDRHECAPGEVLFSVMTVFRRRPGKRRRFDVFPILRSTPSLLPMNSFI
ncbi:uncharacterized protein G2W53_036628 [Senna tora]|uniref:Uncharacterized protein n=1 Tax=Senna tora TaxID=362788 RepID=A0A834W502_9FABA|nr:uncharacterized protein G2W53_036628 [Senna tora]